MRKLFSRPNRLKACGLALLVAGTAGLAAEGPTVPKGSTREQLLQQLGEPRSQIVVGDRLIVFYPRERYVLRNDVIVDFEPISAEPVRRPPPASVPPAPVPPVVAPVVDPAAATAAESREPAAAPAAATPAGRRTTDAAPVAGPAPTVTSVRSAPAAVDPAATPAPAAPAEPRLEIKRVLPRNPGASSVPVPRPVAVSPAPAPASGAAGRAVVPGAAPIAGAPRPVPAATAATAATAVAGPLPTLDAAPAGRLPAGDEPAPVLPDVDPARDPASDAAVAEKKAKVRDAVQRRIEAIGDAPPPDPTTAIWSGKNFAIMFVIVAGGIGYMVWRRRQHQLEMAATAVSHPPFEGPPVNDVASGAVFTADFVGRLDARRFEELVVAYYCKTGVVAVRADEGPGSPVHVKISWKGEKRPFACVHCIAQPAGLVDAKPLQQLFDVITAEGIRRGYVVTTGKFNVSARDFAEEKHLTILHGDLFLEKLNALPGPARNEIMHALAGSGGEVPPAAPAA